MYMTNPIVIHFMKINHPWSDYDRILFYEVVTMNFYEWKKSDRYDGKFYWRNRAIAIRLSLKYNPNPEAKVIHHLRDTEEQRKYNDEHYEYWGFNQDGTFEYGKYVIFVTKEEHTEIHRHSEETRKKMSDSLKGIPRTDEWKLKLSKSNKGKHNLTEEQRLQISKSVKEYYEQDGSREKTSRSTKEAMQRPEVRQRLIDGCKKRPPQSKESRQKAAEANKAKPLSKDDMITLYDYFSSMMNGRATLSIRELSELYHTYKALIISWNTFQKAFREFKHTLN